jgi:hypothetical protein
MEILTGVLSIVATLAVFGLPIAVGFVLGGTFLSRLPRNSKTLTNSPAAS